MITNASRVAKQNLRSFRLLQQPDSQKMNWLCQDTAVSRNTHPSAYCKTLSYFQVPPTLILIVVHFCPVRCTTAQENIELKNTLKKNQPLIKCIQICKRARRGMTQQRRRKLSIFQ